MNHKTKDILERIEDSSPNESSHELFCRLRDCAHEIETLRAALTSGPDAQADERGAFDIALNALQRYQDEWDTGLPSEYAQSERIQMECACEAVREALQEARAAAPAPVSVPERPNPNRAAEDPGGCECVKCGRIFIGGPEHDACGICAAAPQAQAAQRPQHQEICECGRPNGQGNCPYGCDAPQAESAQVVASAKLIGRWDYSKPGCVRYEPDFPRGDIPEGAPVYVAATPSPDREQVGEGTRRVDELSMLIRQLVHALRKAAPDNDLAVRAVDYLKRAGLQGSPLRVEAQDASPSRECGEPPAPVSEPEQPPAESAAVRNKIAAALHYPEHWDAAAYPTLDHAAWEAIATSKLACSECAEQPVEANVSIYVDCYECRECGHVGINDAHPTDAACGYPCGWSGPSPVEDKCPGCGKTNVMSSACPKCSGLYRMIAEAHIDSTSEQPSERVERPIEPEDIDAVAEAIQRETSVEWLIASRAAVAAIDTLIARGNHASEHGEQDCPHGVDDGACKQCYAEATRERVEQNPPFSNCSFRICDLPGQCRSEGKCHHPVKVRECGYRQSFPERDPSKTNAEQGLYRKFEVCRVDGSDAPGCKHHGCEYFVLDITHDQHAPAALRAYAQSCASTHPQLSADLAARFGGERQGATAVVREALEAAFEEREGWRVKVAAAVRTIGAASASIKAEAKCKACGGNDGDMPCAYPEGRADCLRNASAPTLDDGVIPADCDVRKILLRVVPGDGDGYEVYAKNVSDVENLLCELGQRLEDFELARAQQPQAAEPKGLTDKQIKDLFDQFRHRIEDCDSGVDDDNLLDFARALLAAKGE